MSPASTRWIVPASRRPHAPPAADAIRRTSPTHRQLPCRTTLSLLVAEPDNARIRSAARQPLEMPLVLRFDFRRQLALCQPPPALPPADARPQMRGRTAC